MAVAIDTPWLARKFIPEMQRELDREGEDGERFLIHRVSVYATILSHSSEIWRRLYSAPEDGKAFRAWMAEQEVLDWQADPDDDMRDAAVFHHLQRQAATVPLLSSAISQTDHENAITSLSGSALSASIIARTRGRPLSSFHRHSCRLSSLTPGECADPVILSACGGFSRRDSMTEYFLYGVRDSMPVWEPSRLLIWADPGRTKHLVFTQVQVDVIDLSSRSFSTSPPRKRQQTFNQFLQLPHSPGVEDTARRNPLPRAKKINGVRHRPNRNTWVAEWKPPKHKTKQDFGNFKSEAEAALAVDAAFHHYGRPDLLNIPCISLRFLSTRPVAPAGLDEKAMVKFVREEAKLLLAATASSDSPPHSTRTNSLQIPELSAYPRHCPSRPFSEILSPSPCNGPDVVDAVVSQPQPRLLLDSLCEVSTIGVLTDEETLNLVQSAEQGWDRADDSCTLAAPLNPSASESQVYMWPDCIVSWSPAPTYPRSPTPSPFLDETEYQEHQSTRLWSDDTLLE